MPKIAPLYLIIVESIISCLNLKDFDSLKENTPAIVKQRDDIVAHMQKSVRFLAMLMILIFLIEMKIVTIPPSVWGIQLGANEPTIIFGLLLIGNFVALLLSSAMMKMFMLEFTLKNYLSLTGSSTTSFISEISQRFYAFTFGLISEQKVPGITATTTKLSYVMHIVTVILLPVLYISAYCTVLSIAIISLSTATSKYCVLGLSVEIWYVIVLVFFNALTSLFYIFVFFPCIKPAIDNEGLECLIAYNAYRIWEMAERPDGRDMEIWLLSEKQITLKYHIKKDKIP